MPNGHAPERDQVGAAAERVADVLREGPNVSALRAGDANREFYSFEAGALQLHDLDAAYRTIDLFSLARIVVETPAVDVDGGMHRRHLLLGSRGAREST